MRKADEIGYLVIHETAGPGDSPAALKAYLAKNGLGVHYSVTRTGRAVRHNHPLTVQTHAGGGYNKLGVGVDMHFTHGGYGKEPSATPRTTYATRFGAHGGVYSVPPRAQLDALFRLVSQLVKALGRSGVDFPLNGQPDPTAKDASFDWSRSDQRALSQRRGKLGIVSHRRIAGDGHADGGFFEGYLYWRFAGRGHDEAVDAVVRSHSQLPQGLA